MNIDGLAVQGKPTRRVISRQQLVERREHRAPLTTCWFDKSGAQPWHDQRRRGPGALSGHTPRCIYSPRGCNRFPDSLFPPLAPLTAGFAFLGAPAVYLKIRLDYEDVVFNVL